MGSRPSSSRRSRDGSGGSTSPMRVNASGSTTSTGNVASSAWSSPPRSTSSSGSSGRPGDSESSRASRSAKGSRSGQECRATRAAGLAELLERFVVRVGGEEGEARCGSTGIPRERDDVARAGTAPDDGSAPLEIAEGSHRDLDALGGREVSPDDADTGRALVEGTAQAAREIFNPGIRERAREGQRDDEPGRACTHSRDIGQVRGDGFSPEIFTARPVATKIGSLVHRVDGDDDPAIGCVEHRSVISRAKLRVPGCRDVREDACEQAPLPELGDGGPCGWHASTLSWERCSPPARSAVPPSPSLVRVCWGLPWQDARRCR